MSALILLISLTFVLPSCAKKEDEEKIKIVCTQFVQYDWMRQIIGQSDRIELSLLVDNGADIHSYQPTAVDIMEISDCDMIVYLGLDIDGWVSEALERANNAHTRKIALTECEGVTLRNISSVSAEHSHDRHEEHDHEGHNHGSLDEHVWLSLKNAAAITEELCTELCTLDPEGEAKYRANTENYISKLRKLDEEYAETVALADEDERFVLFCDRFPFVYLFEDYGIEYSAAFEGCSTDSNADFATVLRLIGEADEHSLDCVMVTESADRALANTVASSSKNGIDRVLALDSLQAVSRGQIEDGRTYLSVMKENLSVLKLALGIN